jgi:hypothetical protein
MSEDNALKSVSYRCHCKSTGEYYINNDNVQSAIDSAVNEWNATTEDFVVQQEKGILEFYDMNNNLCSVSALNERVLAFGRDGCMVQMTTDMLPQIIDVLQFFVENGKFAVKKP